MGINKRQASQRSICQPGVRMVIIRVGAGTTFDPEDDEIAIWVLPVVALVQGDGPSDLSAVAIHGWEFSWFSNFDRPGDAHRDLFVPCPWPFENDGHELQPHIRSALIGLRGQEEVNEASRAAINKLLSQPSICYVLGDEPRDEP